MKRIFIITLIATLANFFSASAQYSEDSPADRIDSEGNTVHHCYFMTAQYKFSDFDYFKESGFYGIDVVFTSISHWGPLHIGGNFGLAINNGLLKGGNSFLTDFGPSVRYDIIQHAFINIPINVFYSKTWNDEKNEYVSEEYSGWGLRIAPSLHFFLTDRLGLFLGPQMVMGFKSGEKTTFGGQFGISYSF